MLFNREIKVPFSKLIIVLAIFFALSSCASVKELPGLKPVRQLAGDDAEYLTLGEYAIHYTSYGTEPFGDQYSYEDRENNDATGQSYLKEGSDAKQEKPVLVLLHGFLSNFHTWDAVYPALDSSYPVIAYDRLAFGLSERPIPDEDTGEFAAGSNPYTGEAVKERALKLMDKLKGESFVLVGNSAGGNLAVQLAMDYPEKAAALILIDPAIYRNGPPSLVRWLLQLPFFRGTGIRTTRRLAERSDELFSEAWYEPEKVPSELAEHYKKPLQAKNWDIALFEYTKANRDPGIIDRLGSLEIPVLIIHGAEDTVVPLKLSERLFVEIPGASLEVFNECGHVPQEECPDKTAEVINQFLQNLFSQEKE
ncbi:MAG: alpha/beta hydrolase, partial [Spirochaetia bacterium]|nr:alpha/beta hydrolase [Spirochaetia bacterium]